MADDVTPLGMLLRYWNLKVPTPEGTASVMVNSYKCRTPAYGGTEKGKRNWSRAARIGEQDVFEGFRT